MNQKTSSARRRSRSVHARAIWLLPALASLALACSVYDESLKQGVGPSAGGAAGGGAVASSDFDSGAGTSASGGDDNAEGGNLVDAGAPGTGGDSGGLENAGGSNGG